MKRLLLALLPLVACAYHPPLPPPSAPLVATRDAAFRWQTPPLTTAPPVVPYRIEETSLSNGLHVIVVESPGAHLTQLAFVSRRAGDESAELPPGLAFMANELLIDTLWHPAAPDAPSLVMEGWVRHNDAGIRGAIHPSMLSSALMALRVALTSERAREDVVRLRDEVGDYLLHRVGDRALLDHIARLSTYADAVHARPPRGVSSETCALSSESVVHFFGTRYVPSTSTIVVVGRTPIADARALIEAAFNDWTPPEPPPTRPTTPLVRTDGYHVIVLQQWRSTQAGVELMVPLGTVSPRDRVALALFNMMFGGSPGSRVFRALRLERGISYGVNSALLLDQGAASLVVRGMVRHAMAAESVQAILHELADMRTTPVSDSEFERGRALVRQHLRERGDADGDDTLAQTLAEDFVEGVPAGRTVATSLDVLESLTPEDVRRVVAARLDTSQARVVVRGDYYELGDALGDLGLGSVGTLRREFGEGAACTERHASADP